MNANLCQCPAITVTFGSREYALHNLSDKDLPEEWITLTLSGELIELGKGSADATAMWVWGADIAFSQVINRIIDIVGNDARR